MNKPKHTPGPWFLEENEVLDKDSYVIAGIKSVTDHENDDLDKIDFERTRANARLIAAAPELLTALKSLTELIKLETNEEFDTFDQDTTYQVAIAAIAKAEGKE